MLEYESLGYMPVIFAPGTHFMPHHSVFKGMCFYLRLPLLIELLMRPLLTILITGWTISWAYNGTPAMMHLDLMYNYLMLFRQKELSCLSSLVFSISLASFSPLSFWPNTIFGIRIWLEISFYQVLNNYWQAFKVFDICISTLSEFRVFHGFWTKTWCQSFAEVQMNLRRRHIP